MDFTLIIFSILVKNDIHIRLLDLYYGILQYFAIPQSQQSFTKGSFIFSEDFILSNFPRTTTSPVSETSLVVYDRLLTNGTFHWIKDELLTYE